MLVYQWAYELCDNSHQNSVFACSKKDDAVRRDDPEILDGGGYRVNLENCACNLDLFFYIILGP